MCVDAVVFRHSAEPVRCAVQGELAAALRITLAELPIRPDYEGLKPEARHCLCPVDVEALAQMHGLVCEAPEWSDDSDHFDAWALRDASRGSRG